MNRTVYIVISRTFDASSAEFIRTEILEVFSSFFKANEYVDFLRNSSSESLSLCEAYDYHIITKLVK